MNQRQKGFTLIEIMIVVVILGIVSSIAFSAFSDNSRDAQRVRGIADMTSLNDAVGRFYQNNFSYDGLDDAALPGLAVNAGISLTDQYVFTIVVAADGQSYTLTATPVDPRLGANIVATDVTGVQR
ncbi:MAG: type IV pilin protein [Gammaproteobacteria bacterium]